MNEEITRPTGRLYGIGLGPGDPELVTMKASRLLGTLPHIFTPKADEGGFSVAQSIASQHAGPDTVFHELVYPMTRKADVLRQHWRTAAESVAEVLATGKDAGFITLGDPMLYSTCTYLIRAVHELQPSVQVEVVPGVTSFCASAALTEFVLGEQSSKLLVAPAPDSLKDLQELTRLGGRLVLMKVGSKLPQLVEWLRTLGLVQRARLVTRAGLPGQRVLMDLESGMELESQGYLSTLLVDLDRGGNP
jgi:precorrin-2/cobalt-factor-2 C20-methyltransferase